MSWAVSVAPTVIDCYLFDDANIESILIRATFFLKKN